MFSKLRTAAITAFICLSALLAVPAACVIALVATGAHEQEYPHRRSAELERAACTTSPSAPCVMPLR